ncbi:MAG: hypothetical protein KZQ64_12905, partial [gamma proteobacterium symbiont of Bathyaustriella thionipta]|nr:hypothetical protein [gamma proteobacterium symbiont of Bathyaustriella thionipta]MCU7950499.1 hypothetical protein [gamma proteobacterium symbiont of Bathyaustriella thionipta]MCU7954270.1 hypothetical protein [gamma proteobacterium symbiont of Bathyaustriella thionipta]MCU7956997.1 hypothetical protein [gamma proteobacterium symbiont of Bathyaustriella thionipta]MCU7966900.1 hypothetical protein [gamma proteobacterium symbiont of Bathyaustriella thionipta]
MLKKINIKIYFFCTWLFSVYLCSFFLQDIPNNTIRDILHSILLITTYAFMYLSPAFLVYWLFKRWIILATVLAIIFSVISNIFIFIDSRLYDLYAFHINGFVWNLITT